MIMDEIDKGLEGNLEFKDKMQELEDFNLRLEEMVRDANDESIRSLILSVVALIATIGTTILALATHTSTIYAFIIALTGVYNSHQARLSRKEYIREYNKAEEEFVSLSQEIQEVFKGVCDDVEKSLQSTLDEAIYYIKNKKYDEIIKNYTRFERVIGLSDVEAYDKLLVLLVTAGRAGIPSYALTDNETKSYIAYLTNAGDESSHDSKHIPLRDKVHSGIVYVSEEELEEMDEVKTMKKTRK